MGREKRHPVGRITKLYGGHGELSIQLYDTFPADFTTSEPLFVEIDKLAVPLFCTSLSRKGTKRAVVVFEDIDTERRASELLGLEVQLPATRLDAEEDERADGELYWEDLVGFRAELYEEGELRAEGVVEAYIDGRNPLFRLLVAEQEVWIPATEEFIRELDDEAQHIIFDLPEEFLSLYLAD